MAQILFISTNDAVAWGGSEELWSGAAARLVPKGHRVRASTWKHVPEHRGIQALRAAGVGIHLRYDEPIRRGRFGQAILTVLQGAPASRRSNESEAIDQERPDLVVFSLGYQWCPKFARMSRTLRQRGIRYAVVVQLAMEGLAVPATVVEDLREAYQDAARVWFVSQQNKDIVARELGLRFQNASVVDNPVDLDVEAPPYPSVEDGWRLALVGSLTPHHKGQDLVIEVLADPIWKERPLHVTFYGQGAALAALQRWVEVNEVKKVTFHGFEADKSRIWGAHHAALFASRMEGRSLALQEAMAHGRMVISTDVGGARDIIVHGRSGFIAPAVTREGIAQALEEAWGRREAWQRMGEEARAGVRAAIAPDPIGRFAQAVEEALNG